METETGTVVETGRFVCGNPHMFFLLSQHWSCIMSQTVRAGTKANPRRPKTNTAAPEDYGERYTSVGYFKQGTAVILTTHH